MKCTCPDPTQVPWPWRGWRQGDLGHCQWTRQPRWQCCQWPARDGSILGPSRSGGLPGSRNWVPGRLATGRLFPAGGQMATCYIFSQSDIEVARGLGEGGCSGQKKDQYHQGGDTSDQNMLQEDYCQFSHMLSWVIRSAKTIVCI